jgi:hypothetical protein
VLQAVRRLLTRPECFRLEREFAGPDFHRGEQCALARHTYQRRRARHQTNTHDKKSGTLRWFRRRRPSLGNRDDAHPDAKLNGVEPMAWLTDVLERIVSGRTKAHELQDLLPWN